MTSIFFFQLKLMSMTTKELYQYRYYGMCFYQEVARRLALEGYVTSYMDTDSMVTNAPLEAMKKEMGYA